MIKSVSINTPNDQIQHYLNQGYDLVFDFNVEVETDNTQPIIEVKNLIYGGVRPAFSINLNERK